MRKFNFDEFIWLIVQISLLAMIFFLVKSGMIKSFINDKMMVYLYISMGVLVIYIIGQMFKIISIPSRVYVTNKFIPIILVIVLTVTFFYLIPSYTLITSKSINEGNGLLESNVIKIDQSNFKLLYEEEIVSIKGKTVEFEGRIKNIEDDYITLYREIVTCCQSDKLKLEILLLNSEFKEDDIGKFAKVTGEVVELDKIYINVIAEDIIEQPMNLFFHE